MCVGFLFSCKSPAFHAFVCRAPNSPIWENFNHFYSVYHTMMFKTYLHLLWSVMLIHLFSFSSCIFIEDVLYP